MGRQGYVVGNDAPGNIQVAGHVGQGIVGGYILAVAVGNGGVVRHQFLQVVAGIDLLAVNGDGRHRLTAYQVFGSEAVLPVRLTVVSSNAILCGNGSGTRIDGQLAVAEADILILILMLEHHGRILVLAAVRHIGNGGVDGQGDRVVRDRDIGDFAGIRFLTNMIVHDQVARIAVGLSVIRPFFTTDVDVELSGVLGDFQRAVHVGDGIVLGDVVAGGVHNHSVGRHVVHRTHVGDFAGDGQILQRLVQRQLGVGLLVLGQRRAVVFPLIAAGRDGHRLGIDGQAAILHNELHVGEVGIGVLEVLLSQTHGIRACIRAGCRRQIHGGEVIFRVQLVGDADDLVAHSSARHAVIGLGVGNALDGHNHRIGRYDLQGAGQVSEFVVGGHVLAVRIHDDGIGGHQLIRILAYFHSREVDIHRLDGVSLCQVGGGEGGRFVLAVGLTIVGHAQVVVSLDGHLVVACAPLGHLQGAEECGHGVVGRQGALIEGVGVAVVALAHVGLGAGVGQGNALAINETIASHGVGFFSQRRAVVFLFSGTAGQGDAALGDFQAAVGDHERHVGEVLAGVGEVSFLQPHGIGIRILLGDGIRAGEGEVIGCVQGVGNGYIIAGNRVLAAVILHGILVAGDGHGDLVGDGGHGQLAGCGLDVVVLRLGAFIQGVGEGVVTAANIQLAAGDVVGCAFAFGKAVAGNGNVAVGQRGAVVHLGVGGTGQGHVTLGDGQAAIHHHELHVGEVLAGVGEVGGLHVHVIGARIRAGYFCLAGEGEITFLVQLVVNGYRVALHRVSLAVVLHRIVVLGDSDGHLVGHGSHGQGAGFRGDVVVICLGTLVQGVGEGIAAFTCLGLGAGDSVGGAFAVSEAVAGDGDLLVGQCGAVVHLGGGGTGQGHIALVDGQAAVFHNELHVGEVAVLVGEVSCLQTHGVGVRIRFGNGSLAGEGEVACLVQVVIDGHVVAGDGMFVAVIGHGILVAGDGHNHFLGHRGYNQGAVLVGDGVIGGNVLPCRILDMRIGDDILHGAHVGDGAHHGDAGHGIACCQAVMAVAIGGMLRAVVHPFTIAGLHGHSLRIDGHRAVGDNERYLGEVGVLVHEAVSRKTHAGSAGMEACRLSCRALCQAEVACRVQAAGNAVHRVAGDSMFLAVVGVGSGVAVQGHHHFRFRFGHGQLAGCSLDVVVVRLGTFIQGVGEGVVAAANVQLAAGDVVGCAFAVSEAVAGNGNLVIGQCRAVVHLGIGGAGQSHVTLGDGQAAVHNNEHHVGEVLAGIGEVGGLHFHVVSACIRTGHGVVAGEGEVSGCVQGVGNGYIIAGDGVHLAVILGFAIMLGDGDGDLVGHRGHGQLAGFRGDVVVLFFGVQVQFIGEGIAAFAYLGLGAGDRGLEAFLLDESVAGNRHGVVFQCRAVVHLGGGGAGQGHIALVDGQAAVFHNELHVGEVAVLVGEVSCLQTHGVGVRIRFGNGSLAGEGEVACLVQVVIDGHVVAGDGMFVAVIGHGILVAGDGHNHFLGHRGYNQGAVLVGDGVIGGNVLPCRILDMRIGDDILHGAHVGDGAHHGDAGHGIACCQAVMAVAIGGMLRAVVHPFTIAGLHGHSLGLNGHRAVGDNELHVGEGTVVVHEAVSREAHVGGAGMETLCFGGCAFGQAEVAGRVQAAGNAVHRVAGDSMLLAVIGVGSGVAVQGHHHFRCRLGHGQGAGFLGDVVVIRLGIVVQGVGEGVVTAANSRLTAGDVVGSAFAVHKALSGYGVVGQSGTIVGLAISGAGQGHVTLGDDDGAFPGRGQDILAGAVHPIFRQGRHNGGFTCVRAGSIHGDNLGEVRFRLAAVVRGHSVGLSIVNALIALRLNLSVLIVVESDLIGAGGDGHGLCILGYGGVAIDRDGGFLHLVGEGLAGDHLILRHLGGGVVPHIVDGVGQVVPLDVGHGDGLVLGGHGAGDHILAGLIAVNGGRGHGISRTVGHAFGVGFGRLGAILVNIVHGEGEDVLLIVDVDDVFALIRLNGQGQVFRLLQHVAGGALIGVRGHLAAESGGAGCLPILLFRTVQIILHVVGEVIGGVVEGDFLVVLVQGEGLGFRLHHGVAGNRFSRFGDRGVKGLAGDHLILCNRFRSSFLIIVDGVADVRVGRPNGVQHVFTVAVQAGVCACPKGSAGTVGLGVPADEVIAGLGGDARSTIGQHGDQAVVQHGFRGVVVAVAAVSLVGHGHLGIGIHIVGREGGVLVQGDVAAGIVHGACVIRPVGKHLAFGGSEGAVGHTGSSVRAILVGIGNIRTGALAGGVGQGIGLAHENGGDGLVAIQRFVDINVIAICINPLDNGQTMFLDKVVCIAVYLGLSDGSALGNRFIFIESNIAGYVDLDVNGYLGLCPVGIQHHILGRHGAEGIGNAGVSDLRRFHLVPALEVGSFIAVRNGGRGNALAGNICFEHDIFGGFGAHVVQGQGITVAGVVKVYVRTTLNHIYRRKARDCLSRPVSASCVRCLRILFVLLIIPSRTTIGIGITGAIRRFEHVVQSIRRQTGCPVSSNAALRNNITGQGQTLGYPSLIPASKGIGG